MPKLSPREISTLTLPPGKVDVLHFDDAIPGLALRLRAGGKKSWVFQYRVGTKQRRLSLGSATALHAHEARKRAALLHAEVKLGRDPVGDKTAAKARANETFGAVLPLFLARQKERLRPRAFVEVERHLNVHGRRLHHLPLAGITRRDVASVLTAVVVRLSGASANRVRTSLLSFFGWSIREGLLDSNPPAWTERRGARPQPPAHRRRVTRVGHQAGTAGRYNLALYRKEKAAALVLWAEHLLALIEGAPSKVVLLYSS